MSISIVAHGDSITRGFGLASTTLAYPALLETQLNSNGYGAVMTNGGIDSAAFHNYGSNTSLITDALTNVDNLISPTSVLIMLIGTNDIFFAGAGSAAASYAYFQTYMEARLSAGWVASRILVCTILPRSGDAWTDTSNYNALVVAGQANYGYRLVRLDLNVNIGIQNAEQSTTYFQDQVHPTAAGQTEIKNEIYPILTTALTRRVIPGLLRVHS